ncbi:MAG: LuxR C-terminal-related transcriptional regulator, partial [Flavobacteriales bacterium]
DSELLALIQAFETDVVMIDFTAPQFSIDIIPACLKVQKGLRFIAITDEQSSNIIIDAIKAGVHSYIKKNCDITEIIDSVRETAFGGRFFCGKILQKLRRDSINIQDLLNDSYSCEPVVLSERELEIISLIAEGFTNNQIAEKLFLSPHTVNTHRKNILQKLGANNTAAIVMYAVKSNLVSPNKFLFSPSLS